MISFYGIIIIIASVLPPIIFIGVADRFDHDKKEPRKVLFKLFAAGVVMPLAALLLELILVPLSRMIPGGLAIPAEAFLGIALPEEGVKLIALFLIIRRRKDFDEVLDGAVYGIAVAMDSRYWRIFLYVMGSGTPMVAALPERNYRHSAPCGGRWIHGPGAGQGQNRLKGKHRLSAPGRRAHSWNLQSDSSASCIAGYAYFPGSHRRLVAPHHSHETGS
jgi:hypothetical protein